MFNKGKATVLTVILVALMATGAASPAELTMFPQQSSTEINSFTSYEVTVENTGPTEDVYTLTSSNPSEITIAPQRVPENTDTNLQPGESRTVNVWYNPGPGKDAGTYSFDVRATSRASGDTYSTTGEVEVIKDHQVALDIADSKTVCLGEQARYTVNVTNEGIQDETFELTTRHGSLSQNEVTLAPGETSQVTLTASSDSETQKSFNVIAASTSSYAQEIQNVDFNVETCYASDVTIQPQNQSTAAYTEAEFDVTVRNTGTREDTFVLSSNIGDLDDSELEIDAGSSGSTTLTVEPESLGNKRLEVTAKSEVTSTGAATVESYNGMEADVSFEQTEYAICERQEEDLEVEVMNTGEAEETFNLSSTVGQLSEGELELDPEESEELDVRVNSTQLGEDGQVTVTATASTFGEPQNSGTATVSVENCYDLKMDVVPEVASAGENRSTIYEITLDNNGTRENTYELTAEGPDWVSVKPSEVTVDAGESEKAYIYAGIPFGKNTGNVEITANAIGTQVERTQDVRLVIGDDVEEAINSTDNNGPTGRFSQLPSVDVVQNDLGKIVASIIIGLLITAAVIYREW